MQGIRHPPHNPSSSSSTTHNGGAGGARADNAHDPLQCLSGPAFPAWRGAWSRSKR